MIAVIAVITTTVAVFWAAYNVGRWNALRRSQLHSLEHREIVERKIQKILKEEQP